MAHGVTKPSFPHGGYYRGILLYNTHHFTYNHELFVCLDGQLSYNPSMKFPIKVILLIGAQLSLAYTKPFIPFSLSTLSIICSSPDENEIVSSGDDEAM